MPVAILAFSDLMPHSGSVIVKVDRHSGADGNVLVSANSADVAPGTCRTYQVSGGSDYVEAASAVHAELGRGQAAYFVVEVYYHSVHSVGVHYFLNDNRIELAGIADIRLARSYNGMFWPTSLPASTVHRLLAGGYKLAVEVARFGHRGPLSVDAIVSSEGDVLFNEVNARHGGFSSGKAVIDKVMSNRLDASYSVATRVNLKSGLAFSIIRSLMEDARLDYARQRGEGVIVTVEDTGQTDRIEIMTIASTKDRVEELENRFIREVCQ